MLACASLRLLSHDLASQRKALHHQSNDDFRPSRQSASHNTTARNSLPQTPSSSPLLTHISSFNISISIPCPTPLSTFTPLTILPLLNPKPQPPIHTHHKPLVPRQVQLRRRSLPGIPYTQNIKLHRLSSLPRHAGFEFSSEFDDVVVQEGRVALGGAEGGEGAGQFGEG